MSSTTQGALRTITVDGGEVELRYMQQSDTEALLTFVRSVPKHDLMFLPIDITEVEGFNSWVDDMLLGLSAAILAVRDGQIVGLSSVARHEANWMRDIADLHVVVGKETRGQGIGTQLAAEGLRLAAGLGVRRVMTQMTLDQPSALRTFRSLGFVPVAVLHDQVIDTNGETYDLLLMHHEVTASSGAASATSHASA